MARRPYVSHDIVPGGLSDQDRERIGEMADRGLKCGPIARQLRKHPSTVRWFMYQAGIAAPVRRPSKTEPDAVGRKGYGAEEDRFILALRTDGVSLDVIAARVTERFGHPRSHRSVETRLTMLANLDELEEAC